MIWTLRQHDLVVLAQDPAGPPYSPFRFGCGVMRGKAVLCLGDTLDFTWLFLIVLLFAGLPETCIHGHQLAGNNVDNPDGTYHLYFHAGQQWPLVPHHQLPSASLCQCQPQHGHQCQRNSAENHWNQCGGLWRANADTHRLHPHARSVSLLPMETFSASPCGSLARPQLTLLVRGWNRSVKAACLLMCLVQKGRACLRIGIGFLQDQRAEQS